MGLSRLWHFQQAARSQAKTAKERRRGEPQGFTSKKGISVIPDGKFKLAGKDLDLLWVWPFLQLTKGSRGKFDFRCRRLVTHPSFAAGEAIVEILERRFCFKYQHKSKALNTRWHR